MSYPPHWNLQQQASQPQQEDCTLPFRHREPSPKSFNTSISLQDKGLTQQWVRENGSRGQLFLERLKGTFTLNGPDEFGILACERL